MRTLFLTTACALGFSAMNTLADTNTRGLYIGAGGSFVDSNNEDEQGNNVEFNVVEGYVGYKYNGYLGVEARIGTALSSDDATTLSGTSKTEFDLNYYAGVYWRPEQKNEVAKLYGLFGYATTEIDQTALVLDQGGNFVKPEGGLQSNSVEGFSYGIGVGFVLDEHFNLNFEYKSIIDTDTTELSGFALNVDYRF